jgi:hypothetical protein
MKPWMAINILEQSKLHSFKHDLESFFWVLYYLLALTTGKDQDLTYTRKVVAALGGMCNRSYNTVADHKHLILTKKPPLWINPIYSIVAGHMEALRQLLGVEILHNAYLGMALPGHPEVMYKSFLDIIDEVLHDLGSGCDVSQSHCFA